MELKNIEQIEEGMVVFMPSGIQATLHKDGEDILVKYPELYEDRYNKKDFEEIINEGIIIFNEPSVIMEALEQDYKLTIIVGRDRDSNGKLKEVSFKAKNDVDAFLQVLAKYDTCCSGYFNGDYEGELDPEELERDQKIKAAAETGENQEEALQILSDLYNETMDISDYYDDIVTLTAPDGHIVFEDDIDVDAWFEDEEDDFDESLKEAYENAKNPEGSIFKAMKEKDVEIVTAEFKNEALIALTKIAKEFPNGHVRQQALTFMDELGLQEYYDLKVVRKFIDKHLEKLAEFNSVNESLNETNTEINYYGVQYRNMRTGIHQLLYTDTEENAEQILKYLNQMEKLDSDIYSEEELEHQINFIWNEINKLDLGGFEINYRDVSEDGMYDDIYIINYANTKPDIYESLEDYNDPQGQITLKDAKKQFEELVKEAHDIYWQGYKFIDLTLLETHCPAFSNINWEDIPELIRSWGYVVLEEPNMEEPAIALGKEFTENDLRQMVKDFDKENGLNESLNEEKGELADNDNLKHIAKDLENGLKSGKELYEFGNWICETSLDEKWETLTKEMKDYILENISYPVTDGHIKYYDLNVLFYGDSFTKEDLMSLDTFTEEEILEAKAEDKELQIFMAYEIKYDSNLEEAFKEKKKNKKKLDEINKDGKMNEDCYKVYNSLCPECDPVSLGSWNEVEEYLNNVWGEYKADRCKENNEFGSEQDREEFMGSFDVAFIEPVEVIEVPTEEQEIVEEPELTKEEVEEIKDEVEDCLDQLENEVKDEEELQEAFADADLEYEFKTVRRNALANPNLYGGKYTQKNIKDARKEFLTDKQPKNEDFTDNMGMLTDVNDVDMPDALKASIPVTKDGEVLTPDKYAQEIENLKQLITSMKTDLLTEIKNEIKMALMDVKNDIKTDVNDVENKVDDTKDAVDNLTMEAEVAEEIEEEPLEEEPAAEEEQVEESYINPLKQFLKKGMIEDIAKVKSEIDKAVVQGKSAEEVKNTITLLADDEKEQEEASQYALNKMTESLLRHSQNAPLAGIATIQTGLTLK